MKKPKDNMFGRNKSIVCNNFNQPLSSNLKAKLLPNLQYLSSSMAMPHENSFGIDDSNLTQSDHDPS